MKKGYYSSKSDLLRDAFRVLLNTRSELKISLAIELYLVGKTSISRAAEFTGVPTIEFKEIMAGRGIVRGTEGKFSKEMDAKLEKTWDSLMFFADTDIPSAFAKSDAAKYLKHPFADMKISPTVYEELTGRGDEIGNF